MCNTGATLPLGDDVAGPYHRPQFDAYREVFGVEPCRSLELAPSAVGRRNREVELTVEITRVFEENFGVDGAPKIRAQLSPVARLWSTS